MAEESSKTPFNVGWLFKMAWRDSRRSRSRLFLFISSIILGIAALVAIYSFGDNLRKDIDLQAAGLLGADLSVSINKDVSKELQGFLDSLGDNRSEQRSFGSMVYFKKSRGTRLVQVKALSGDFPYYGSLETIPVRAGRDFRKQQEAIVDKTLMLQFNAAIGDSVKVGEISFKIAGVLEKAPGQTGLFASVAPAIYIPLSYLDKTGLSKKGSRINYQYFYKFKDQSEAEILLKKIEPRLEKSDLDYQTIAGQKRDTGRAFDDLTRFLSLVGFVALLLGCIGVASAIHIYIREKLATIAILRCLGANALQTFLIYLIQIVGIGLIGSILGALLGTFIQQVLPYVLQDLLPVEISTSISWPSIFQGVLLGVIISLLFALLPLVSVRSISPLNTLRISYQQTSLFKDPVKWLVYLLILLFVIGFSYLQLKSLQEALILTAAVISAFLILTGTAALLVKLVRKFFPSSWSYLWRQGLANLFRPNNQTLILIVSIGLGTAFISTLFIIQDTLLKRVTLSASGNQPNTILFDIQNNQKDKVAALTKQEGLPVISQVPIVTMRIEEINGYTLADVKKDSTINVSKRAYNSELRVTYRDTITSAERISQGKWIGKTTPEGVVNVSFEEGYAKRIKVNLGDSITFNVQGTLVPAVVSSFREVDWNRVETNFRLVFPTGVLEDAPQFYVLMTRAKNKQESVRYQEAIVQAFPNVSVIDLDLILNVLDEILRKIGFVIQFMAAFSIITGLIVLIASVLISKYQRIQESVLLRTLGGSRKQILIITALEYFFLGALAAATGILLSLAGSWALTHYSFKTAFNPQPLPLIGLFFIVSVLTVIIGLINSRGILNKPPLEILRGE
jgi:putative ABC transport system permease protein